MQAFHSDPAIKEKYLARVRAHAAADRLIQGTGWENGKGCAVGCTFERYDHSRGPVEIGVPEWLMHLEDRIFEGLPHEDAMCWPEQFLAAIPVGADLEPVRAQFLIRVQERNLERLKDAPEPYGEQCRAAIRGVIDWLKNGSAAESAESAWSAARSAARSAAESAESAWSAARSAAWSAARSAAESAEPAESAESAWSAARSAARSAWSAARSAAESAESAEYQQQASDLLKLLGSAR